MNKQFETEKMQDMQEDVVLDFTDRYYDHLDEFHASNKYRTVQLILGEDGEMKGIRERENYPTIPF